MTRKYADGKMPDAPVKVVPNSSIKIVQEEHVSPFILIVQLSPVHWPTSVFPGRTMNIAWKSVFVFIEVPAVAVSRFSSVSTTAACATLPAITIAMAEAAESSVFMTQIPRLNEDSMAGTSQLSAITQSLTSKSKRPSPENDGEGRKRVP
jgi:hypothetical protein